MKTIKKEVYTDDGFEEMYYVNFLQFKITEENFEEIKICWNYLENKKNQKIQINIDSDELHISSDDNDFDEEICESTINVNSNRTIYVECSDYLGRTCWSVTVTELELIEALKAN